jgi:hypothetical protein
MLTPAHSHGERALAGAGILHLMDQSMETGEADVQEHGALAAGIRSEMTHFIALGWRGQAQVWEVSKRCSTGVPRTIKSLTDHQ